MVSDTTYIETIGRRKAATARVRLYEGKGDITVNEKSHEKYFPTDETRNIITDALNSAGILGKVKITALVKGGGTHAQAEAVRLGIARALIERDAETRPALKKAGFLKRDPRVVERKKFGLHKARRAPQWSKR